MATKHNHTLNDDFCFDCWRAEREQKRALRRLELEDAFRFGKVVRQRNTIWSTAGVIHNGIRADVVFIEPYQSDPVYLAEHIESREHGFGFKTEILHVS